jgi:hypothetical protein
MIRKAVLIGAPGEDEKSSTYLHGVQQDILNYEHFLRSPLGGSWDASEITTLWKPKTRDEVLTEIDSFQADYAFVVFCGHGYIDKKNMSTYVDINKDEAISVYELDSLNKRQTTVIDACRSITSLTPAIPLFEQRMFKGILQDSTRKIFDAAVNQAEEGTIIIYSAGKNQSAGENSSGGYFTQSLLTFAQDCGDTVSKLPLMNIHDAFEGAKQQTKTYTRTQTPELEAGRRKRYFPFAINDTYTL